jgi:glycosyltransferase involved in cell wall biosynthesis
MDTQRKQPLHPKVSIIIPAWNEACIIAETLEAIREAFAHIALLELEIIVVDDGSQDNTIEMATPYADRVICHSCNMGKGTAMYNGWRVARGNYIIFLDADLGKSAGNVQLLLKPLIHDEYDMTIAELPMAQIRGGFGLVKGLAAVGIYRLCGYHTRTPLSGQRAIRREVLERIGGLSRGFGVEVGLTIDVARAGYRIGELPVPFRHRESGRDLQGFYHRGKQFVSVGRTLIHKWLHPIC